MSRNEQLSTALNLSGFFFGTAGLLAPRLLRQSFGVDTSVTNPEAETVLRMWGARLIQTAALGTVIAQDDALRARGLQVLVATNLTSVATLLLAGRAGAVPMRTAVQIAATDLLFAGVAAAALQD